MLDDGHLVHGATMLTAHIGDLAGTDAMGMT